MSTASDRRDKENAELHTPGKPTRLKVGVSHIREVINGQMIEKKAGTVFDHPAPKRAQQLIDAGLVTKTDAPTAEEVKDKKMEDEVALDLIGQELKEKSKKILKERKEKIAALTKTLEGMKADVLAVEAKKRGIESKDGDDLVKLILANEEAKLKADI